MKVYRRENCAFRIWADECPPFELVWSYEGTVPGSGPWVLSVKVWIGDFDSIYNLKPLVEEVEGLAKTDLDPDFEAVEDLLLKRGFQRTEEDPR